MSEAQLCWTRVKLVHECFVKPADEDYLVARFAMMNRISRQFAWSAAQAVEKYCKAILILNGKSVAASRHDLSDLFKSVCEIAQDLICENIQVPHGDGADFYLTLNDELCSFEESAASFVTRLNEIGDPNQRYREGSAKVTGLCLSKLDILCFQLRRLCVPLGNQTRNVETSEPITFRDALMKDKEPDLQSEFASLKIKISTDGAVDEYWQLTNCAYSESGFFRHFKWLSYQSSPLITLACTSATAKEDFEWFKKMAKVSEPAEERFKNALKEMHLKKIPN